MKIKYYVPVMLLLSAFTFTSIASAYSTHTVETITSQLQGITHQLQILVSQLQLYFLQKPELAATVRASVVAGSKPNIIFLLTDDLDYNMMSQLPKIKSMMADKGMTFQNHFVSLSLCCPSRAATLCGEYAHNTGVFTNEATNTSDGTNGAYTAFQKFGDDSKTMAIWLQNAGYSTALMGKYLNGYSADAGVPYTIPQGWTNWAVPLAGNAYAQYNYTLDANGTPEPHYLANCNGGQASSTCKLSLNGATNVDKQANFMMNVIKNKAIDFISTNAAAQKPFFLYLAPYTPHSPSTPAPKYESLINDSTWLAANPLPRPDSFNEADVSDKPSWLKNNAPLLTDTDIAALTKVYQKRLISMYAVQDMLNDLITALANAGQLNNTYIVFTSDNGFHTGEHRLTDGKLTEFDTDLHVPLIIRGPGVATGTVTTQITANVDIAPTFAALAGLPIPDSVDGRSFMETLLGSTSVPRNALLLEHADPVNYAQLMKLTTSTGEPRDTATQNSPIKGGEFVTSYSGIRTAQYTYIHYVKNSEEELYDNLNDPQQLVNIAATASSTLMSNLRTWTTDLSTCKGATCRSIEAESRLPQ